MRFIHSVSFAVFYNDFFCFEFSTLAKAEQYIKNALENNPDMEDGYTVRVKDIAVIKYRHDGNYIYVV